MTNEENMYNFRNSSASHAENCDASPVSTEVWDFFSWTFYWLVQQLPLGSAIGIPSVLLRHAMSMILNLPQFGFPLLGSNFYKDWTGVAQPKMLWANRSTGHQDDRLPMSNVIRATLSEQDLKEQEISTQLESLTFFLTFSLAQPGPKKVKPLSQL